MKKSFGTKCQCGCTHHKHTSVNNSNFEWVNEWSHLHVDGRKHADIYCCHRFSFAQVTSFLLLLLWLQLHVLVIYCTWINLFHFDRAYLSIAFAFIHLLFGWVAKLGVYWHLIRAFWCVSVHLFAFCAYDSCSSSFDWHTPSMGRPT